MRVNNNRTSPIPAKMRDVLQSRWAVVDFETDGIDPMKCNPVSVAFMRYDGLQFYSLINPLCPIAPDATRIHNITDEMVSNAPTFPELYPFLHYGLAGLVFGAYNLDFDLTVMDFTSRRYGLDFPIPVNNFCVMRLYAKHCELIGNGSKWRKLGAAASECGIETERGALHNALFDVQTAVQIMRCLADM